MTRCYAPGAMVPSSAGWGCLQLTCVGTCPMQCHTLLEVEGRMPLRVLWFGVSEEHNRLFN